MSAGLKLSLAVAVVVGATAYMAYVGASDSWQYYLTADECLADVAKYTGQRLRVSGPVAAGSLQVDAQRTQARFALRGKAGQLPVVCGGALPDNLAEGREVVVEGRLDASGCLQGEKLLTRCASKYEQDRAAAAGSATSGAVSEGAP